MESFIYILSISDQSMNLNLFHSKAWQIFLSQLHKLCCSVFLQKHISFPPCSFGFLQKFQYWQFVLSVYCWGFVTSTKSINRCQVFSNIANNSEISISCLFTLCFFLASDFIVVSPLKLSHTSNTSMIKNSKGNYCMDITCASYNGVMVCF